MEQLSDKFGRIKRFCFPGEFRPQHSFSILHEQYQGGGGQTSEEPEKATGNNCIKKLVLVNEIVYEEKIKVWDASTYSGIEFRK